jgi:DNA polymerase-3 subunit epsilon
MLNRALAPLLGTGLPQQQVEISGMYYDYKLAQIQHQAHLGSPQIDLRFDTLMQDLGLPQRDAHDALNDAVMAALAFIKLRRLLHLKQV